MNERTDTTLSQKKDSNNEPNIDQNRTLSLKTRMKTYAFIQIEACVMW